MIPTTSEQDELDRLKRNIREIIGAIQGKSKRHGDFIQYNYYSAHSPDEMTDHIMRLIAQHTKEAERRAREDELRRLPLSPKSLLYDLAYQGPDVSKKYREEMLNYYKGYNDYMKLVIGRLAKLASATHSEGGAA